MLLLRAGDGVVVLHHAHRPTKHVQMRLEVRFGYFGCGCELLADLQKVIADSLEALHTGTRREVSGPVGMRIAGVGEEVVGFRWPSDVCVVQRFQIARRCGVEQVEDFAAFNLDLVGVPKARE